MKKSVFAVLIAMLALVAGVGQPAATQAAEPDGRGHGHYANVNGLRMYYEVHGHRRGQPPLVLLHGAFSAIGSSFGELLPTLARKREVIAIELQAHGRTADIDRPLRTELMAGDVVELLRQLGIQRADFFGYSMGGAVAFDIGLRHPDRVRKLIVASITYHFTGVYPGLREALQQVRPEQLHGTVWHQEYLRIAPRPQDFPILVEKVKSWDASHLGYPADVIRGLQAPTLIIIGDSDIVRPEHSVEMFRLLGGGIPAGDASQLPKSELAILPGTAHATLVERADLILPMIPAFLNRPMP